MPSAIGRVDWITNTDNGNDMALYGDPVENMTEVMDEPDVAADAKALAQIGDGSLESRGQMDPRWASMQDSLHNQRSKS